jgi:hypothetical protein
MGVIFMYLYEWLFDKFILFLQVCIAVVSVGLCCFGLVVLFWYGCVVSVWLCCFGLVVLFRSGCIVSV